MTTNCVAGGRGFARTQMADLRIDGGRYYRLKYDGTVSVAGDGDSAVQFDGLHAKKLVTSGSVRAKDATVTSSFSAGSAEADRLEAGSLHIRGAAKLVSSRVEDGGSVGGALVAGGLLGALYLREGGLEAAPLLARRLHRTSCSSSF